MKKRRITAAILAAVMTVSAFGTSGLFQTGVSREITAEAATDPYGTPYDPVVVDENDTIIVVDPGHGGSDSGAVGNGFKEKNLNLAIATALRDRLEQYRNVKVYMTRYEDYFVGLTARTDYAASVKADAFVSVHLNSATASAHGAEVWYPNSSYDTNVYNTGKNMAAKVLAGLVNMGLTSRGYSYKNSKAGSKYPDGSIADYYAVIRRSKLHHIPGIIIEGAFIKNKSDVSNYLNSDEKTTAMGSTDADSIAKAFNMTLKDGTEMTPGVTRLTSAKLTGKDTDIQVTWNQTANVTQYVVFRKTGATGKWKEIGRTGDTSYTDTTPSYGTTYYYTVIGRNDSGRAESYDTTGLNVTTPRDDVTLRSATDTGLSRVKVTWEKKSDATGYRVYRKTTGGSFKKIATLHSNKDSYTDETAAKNTSYEYTVRAYTKVNGVNIWSTCKKPGVTVKTDGDSAGTLTSQAAADNKSITLTWPKSADSDVTYRIYKKTGDGKYTKVFQAAPGAELRFTDTDIAAGTTYKYRLRFYRKNSAKKTFWSSYSNVVTFTTPAAATDTPTTDEHSQTANVQKPAAEKTPAEVSADMKGVKVSWRSAYTSVKSSTDKTDYDSDSRDYVTPASETSLTLHWTPVKDVTGYQILDGNGKRITSVKGTGQNSYTVTGLKARTTYSYMIRPFKSYQKKNYFGQKSDVASGTTAYVIKGKSGTNPAQMARYYNSRITSKKSQYPADVYTAYGAPTINDFTQIVYDEANKAGIRAEVLFAQICKETNYLTFGGDVSAEQCNFGGIGATGNKNPGIDFVKYAEYYYRALGYATPEQAVADAVRVGVRAQATHLALYASNDGKAPVFSSVTAVNSYPNIGTVVVPDPRAGSWLVGYAPYVEWLGTKDNYYTTGETGSRPSSKGWATSNNYGYSLVSDYIEPLIRS